MGPLLLVLVAAAAAAFGLAVRAANARALAQAAPATPAAAEPWISSPSSPPGHEAFSDDPGAVPDVLAPVVAQLVPVLPSLQPTPERPLTAPVLPGKCSVCELPAGAGPYADAIRAAESRHGVPAYILGRLLDRESRFDPLARGAAGEVGIAQFMPGTAADLGIDPRDAAQSIDGAGLYLRQLYDRHGSWAAALAAYNWGTGNVARYGAAAAPASTQAYVRAILGA